jgi:hypothetical protein
VADGKRKKIEMRRRKARKDFLIAAGLPSTFLFSSDLLPFCPSGSTLKAAP